MAVKAYNKPEELWDELGLKDEEPWYEFKKRLLQNTSKPMIYDREGRKMLNVFVSRGFKHWLTENGKLSKKKWVEILNYFTPIVHKEKNKYATEASDDDPNEGFTLSNIAFTLDCPAFLGPAGDEDCKKLLSEKGKPGEHCYRFSSQKGNFVMHLLGDDRAVNAYKIYPEESKHKLYLAFKGIREDFKTLAELEKKMPEWKAKFGVPFITKTADEFATLDPNETNLLNWLTTHSARELYPKIIDQLSLKMDLEESLEGLKALKEDATFQASITNEIKDKLENAFKEDDDEKSTGKTKTATKIVKKKVVKKKEKVLL